MKFRTCLHREKRWFASRRPSCKFLFILLGILSTVWFIIRVVPRPSRATYPCMQAAAPFATGFLAYVSGLGISVAAIRWLRMSGLNFISTGMAVLGLFVGSMLMIGGDNATSRAGAIGITAYDPPNSPIGQARGIFPGRVVWVWDANATDENCTNEAGDYWFQDDNVDMAVIRNMLSEAIQRLTGEDSDSLAWDALFRHYNSTHGNNNTGYQPGQKIAIKINLTTGGWGNVDLATYDKILNLEMMDSTPQLVVAILEQLVDIYGIPQENISIGDPIRNFYNQYWDRCFPLYPDVHYLDKHGYLGRTKVVNSPAALVHYGDGTLIDSLPTAYEEADYMINMGCLKQHDLAGGTFCAKNHFGSIGRDWALHLHYALPSPTSNGFENLGYGKFRNLVDLMEHKDLGEKTVLFLLDGIWGGELPVTEPVKWQITPFNDDWPNSIFVSQDHVAIESVGMDFVRAQFDEYADMLGADDYLHQAADWENWAEGITYDPENDGSIIQSLGVHEHWNNDVDKQYTRNLGTGDGIELVSYLITDLPEVPLKKDVSLHTWPNPCRERVNFDYRLEKAARLRLHIYSPDGRLLRQQKEALHFPGTYQTSFDMSGLPAGTYMYRMDISGGNCIAGKILRSGL